MRGVAGIVPCAQHSCLAGSGFKRLAEIWQALCPSLPCSETASREKLVLGRLGEDNLSLLGNEAASRGATWLCAHQPCDPGQLPDPWS